MPEAIARSPILMGLNKSAASFFFSCVRSRVKMCKPLSVSMFHFLFVIIISGARLSPLRTAVTDGDCGAIGGMKIVRRNRSTWSKSA
jgi:hypothetical protein